MQDETAQRVENETKVDALDHRCRSGKRCVARSGEDAAATAKPHTLCPSCIDSLQKCRDQLIAAQDAVRILVGMKPVTAQTSKISATKEPATPLNLAAETLVTDIDEVLSRVGNYLVRDLVSQPEKKFKAWRGDYEQLVFWDGVSLALQIGTVYRRAMKLIGFEAQWQRRLAPCWSCKFPCLGQFTGSETIECSNCGERKTDEEYQSYCLDIFRGK